MLASPQPAWRRDTLIWARRLFRGQEHETKVLLHKMAKASSSSSSILLIAIRVRSLTGETCSIRTLPPRSNAARAATENSALS